MRISIRSLLLLILLLCLPLAGFYNRYHGKRAIAEFVKDQQGGVRWNYQQDGWYDSYSPYTDQHIGPTWIRKILGDDALAWVSRISVKVDSDSVDRANRLLGNGPALRGLKCLRLFFEPGLVQAEFDATVLADLDDVRFLELSGLTLETSAFESIAAMDDLEILFISGCDFKIEDAMPLTRSKHLAWVEISSKTAEGKQITNMREFLPQAFISY